MHLEPPRLAAFQEAMRRRAYPVCVSFEMAPLDARKERICLERLSEQAKRPDRYRLLIQMRVRQSGNENDRRHDALPSQFSDEAESAYPGHVNVGDNAVEAVQAIAT